MRFQEIHGPHDLWHAAGGADQFGFGGRDGVQGLSFGGRIQCALAHCDGKTSVTLEIIVDTESSVHPILYNGEVVNAIDGPEGPD